MLARRGHLQHPTAGSIELPLLVPAFSSKGFEIRQRGTGKARRPYSEIAYQLEEFGKHPRNSVLISAYDMHFRHFEAPKLLPNAPTAYLGNVNVVLLDSGGYELSPEYDSTEPKRYSRAAETFTLTDYHAILDRLHLKATSLPPFVIANYDHDHRRKKTSLADQIAQARDTFGRYSHFASDFIIKPSKGRYVDPADLTDKEIGNLRGFNIVGVTEKELGRDLFDKLKNVALLRSKLDAQKIVAPIHVWGGLEPLSTPLFFFAGAQIVDGVSWLRYAYRNGLAIVRDTYCVLSEIGLSASNPLNHSYASLNNLSVLENLTLALRQWVDLDGRDFSMFAAADVRHALQEGYKTMCANIPVLGNNQPAQRRSRRQAK